jgi:hypothetical protein
MWWPHTQGCASLALGWRMLALQAKEETAATAKSAGKMPAIHEGETPSLRATTAKNTAGTAVLLTGGTPVLRATTAKNTGGPVRLRSPQTPVLRATTAKNTAGTVRRRSPQTAVLRATTAKNTAGDGSASLTAGARATSDNVSGNRCPASVSLHRIGHKAPAAAAFEVV